MQSFDLLDGQSGVVLAVMVVSVLRNSDGVGDDRTIGVVMIGVCTAEDGDGW